MGEYTPGNYILTADARIPGTEIIWIDKGESKIKWGVTEAFVQDSIMISAHGVAYIKIINPTNFFNNVLTGKIWIKIH
ncbi:MAG: hypothetical protein ACTSRP_13030 [Candidatus Helarchaeota archaeon]